MRSQLVKRGLRAQTQLAGITGQQYLALDFLDPAKYPPLEFQWTPKYTYLPSAPSLTGEIIANAQTFLASLNEADIKTLGQNLNALVVDLDKKLSEVPVAELSAKAHDVLKNANATFERIDRILAAAPNRPDAAQDRLGLPPGSTRSSPTRGSSRRSTTSRRSARACASSRTTAIWTAWSSASTTRRNGSMP